MFNRIHLVVLDSVGIGEAPDSEHFDDLGANTLGHITEEVEVDWPNFERLGLGNIAPLRNVLAQNDHLGYVTKLEEESVGKDTMTGHWELTGLISTSPFPTYPKGFPQELLDKIEDFSGRKVVCNLPYSGTKVIDDYGPHQMETGDLIVYTSADPVLQIAAHEEIIPLEELYRICEYVRSITREEPWVVGRVIARPYIGEPGNFKRTVNRHDYAVKPTGHTVLNTMKNAGYDVIAVGKINDIYSGEGITDAVRTKSNMDGVDQLLKVMDRSFKGLSFTNLVDFDALYGHRRDVQGYADALTQFDHRLPEIMDKMADDDLLIITADHGNDPTYKGTDHTREYIPVLMYSPSMQKNGELEVGHFADIAATIAENFGLEKPEAGVSLLKALK